MNVGHAWHGVGRGAVALFLYWGASGCGGPDQLAEFTALSSTNGNICQAELQFVEYSDHDGRHYSYKPFSYADSVDAWGLAGSLDRGDAFANLEMNKDDDWEDRVLNLHVGHFFETQVLNPGGYAERDEFGCATGPVMIDQMHSNSWAPFEWAPGDKIRSPNPLTLNQHFLAFQQFENGLAAFHFVMTSEVKRHGLLDTYFYSNATYRVQYLASRLLSVEFYPNFQDFTPDLAHPLSRFWWYGGSINHRSQVLGRPGARNILKALHQIGSAYTTGFAPNRTVYRWYTGVNGKAVSMAEVGQDIVLTSNPVLTYFHYNYPEDPPLDAALQPWNDVFDNFIQSNALQPFAENPTQVLEEVIPEGGGTSCFPPHPGISIVRYHDNLKLGLDDQCLQSSLAAECVRVMNFRSNCEVRLEDMWPSGFNPPSEYPDDAVWLTDPLEWDQLPH